MSRDEILTELDNLLKDSTYEELNFYLELVQRIRGKEQNQAPVCCQHYWGKLK